MSDNNPDHPTWVNGKPLSSLPVPEHVLAARRQVIRDRDEAIRATVRREDDAHEQRLAAERAEVANEHRARAVAEMSTLRATIERDLRQNGASATEAARLAGEAVADVLRDRALTAAAVPSAETTLAELREFRRGRNVGKV